MNKFKLTFDPTAIIPPTCYMDSKTIKSRLRSISYVDLNPLLEATQSSVKRSILNSVKKSRWSKCLISMRISMIDSLASLDLYSPSVLREIQSSIVNRRAKNQMLASIIVNLSQKEYETKFIQKQYVGTMPYCRVKLLAHDYHYFNKLGLFPVSTFYRNLYLISSWKNPRRIKSMMIRNLL